MVSHSHTTNSTIPVITFFDEPEGTSADSGVYLIWCSLIYVLTSQSCGTIQTRCSLHVRYLHPIDPSQVIWFHVETNGQ